MDENAFEQIARRLRQKALTTSRSCGADDMEAEDIAQEVMLRLWQMREELEQYESIEGLTTVISKNLTRNQQRRMPMLALQEDTRLVAGTANPHDQLEEAENEKWLQRRISELPSTQHTILYMRQVEECDHQEIARRLGIEVTSVSTLLARARRTLLEDIRKRRK